MGACCSAKSTAGIEEPGKPGPASKAPQVAVSNDIIEKKVAQSKKTGVLALRECGLKALPPGATAPDASSLRTVDLTSNLLKALPDNIGGWSSLQNLQLGGNQLTALPASLGQMVALQKLVLSGNKLRALPTEISLLGKVKVLQLDDNSLGPKLPADIFGGTLSASLEELDLTGNGLEELPTSICSQQKLTRLVLARNLLKSLPAELGGLMKLQYLDAAENSLTSIPQPVVACPSLSELWLKGNPIDRLQLQAMPGFEEFLERRKQRLDAKIGANVVGRVDLAVCG
eukprot:CAMPEP_0197635830 /NCGR_PEP_ID=MMETSP1338-20131121/11536_1 /TAXON_ID=43686 ORGANISM="Pelagodinium beii, Strain RCC1491" /NCGR_SAMPLE_ID=MMETSP1338 /ASSEMBLY_ACC=CAM_ASM_000754 /LENGTH=285 /DNA_ID=CAMNT_0043207955 /DNA_START=42 /DNA_END=896 /DNA_ORIENTATION=-